jgi:adenylosuccinate synthase
MRQPIQIVQGAQYGSEAKGAIAAWLCEHEAVDFAVRTGATNAGHTVYYNGVAYKMQQLPVGWVNPDTRLVLGAGALIDIDILKREIDMVTTATGHNVIERLFIDYRATVHLKTAAELSATSGRHHRIGATGKGCSQAMIDKLNLRGLKELTVGRRPEFSGMPLTDTVALLNGHYNAGAKIQLEGTQGTLLDLHLGEWPYVTHKQTGPAQWMMEAGLSPALPTDIVFVVRTYPIRVAGSSGRLPNEISWVDLASRLNYGRQLKDKSPLVSAAALEAFAAAVVEAGKGFDLPAGSNGLDMHWWSMTIRDRHRVAASELHATAIKSLDDATVAELSKVFEFTTVTRKLRRIAKVSAGDLRYAAMISRPTRVAVTFMNYAFPEHWGETYGVTNEEERWAIENVQRNCLAPVDMISRGPESKHIIQL